MGVLGLRRLKKKSLRELCIVLRQQGSFEVEPSFLAQFRGPCSATLVSCFVSVVCKGICLGQSPCFCLTPTSLAFSVHCVTGCPLHHFHLVAPLFWSPSFSLAFFFSLCLCASALVDEKVLHKHMKCSSIM